MALIFDIVMKEWESVARFRCSKKSIENEELLYKDKE